MKSSLTQNDHWKPSNSYYRWAILLDGGLFDFSEEEMVERRLVLQEILEKSLGAEPGTFNFMNNASQAK